MVENDPIDEGEPRRSLDIQSQGEGVEITDLGSPERPQSPEQSEEERTASGYVFMLEVVASSVANIFKECRKEFVNFIVNTAHGKRIMNEGLRKQALETLEWFCDEVGEKKDGEGILATMLLQLRNNQGTAIYESGDDEVAVVRFFENAKKRLILSLKEKTKSARSILAKLPRKKHELMRYLPVEEQVRAIGIVGWLVFHVSSGWEDAEPSEFRLWTPDDELRVEGAWPAGSQRQVAEPEPPEIIPAEEKQHRKKLSPEEERAHIQAGERVLAELLELKADVLRASAPFDEQFGKVLKKLKDVRINNLSLKQSIAGEINWLLATLHVRVRCPGCGQPAWIRVINNRSSPHGSIQFEHNVSGGQDRHKGSVAFHEMTLIKEPGE